MNLKAIRKAIVPVAIAAALWLLAKIGLTQTPELAEQVTLIITAILVYLIPNEG